jgi:hypothetical protein
MLILVDRALIGGVHVDSLLVWAVRSRVPPVLDSFCLDILGVDNGVGHSIAPSVFGIDIFPIRCAESRQTQSCSGIGIWYDVLPMLKGENHKVCNRGSGAALATKLE